MLQRCLIALTLVWGALLFVPAFAPQTQRMRAPLEQNARWPYPPLFDKTQLRRALDKHPANGLLEVEQLGTASGNAGPNYWRKFDAIVARHPTDLGVLRAKMLQATSGGLVRRIWTPAVGPPGGNSPRETAQTNPRTDQWKTRRVPIVKQARVGQTLAPDDAFFHWMEAMALWDKDDESALQALARAGRAKTFDDGSIEQRRGLMRLREELGPLQWDEKLAGMWGALFPHLAQMRTLQNEVVWSGIARYRRGDKAGAYRRWQIALEAASVMRRAQSQGKGATLIGMLVGEAMQRNVWEIIAKELNPVAGKIKPTLLPDERLLGAFQTLARRDGQADLADFAQSERADFQSKVVNPDRLQSYHAALGLSRADVRLTLQLPWLERNVFWLSITGVLCLVAALVWRRRVGAAFPRASGNQIAFFGALWLGILGLAIWQRTGPEFSVFRSLSSGDGDQSRPVLAEVLDNPLWFWAAVATTFALAIGLRCWRHAREERRLRAQVLKSAPGARGGARFWPVVTATVWVFLLFWSLLAAGVTASDWAILRPSWIGLTALALLLSLVTLAKCAARADLTRGYVAIASAFLVLLAFGLAIEFGVRDNLPTPLTVGVLVSGALAILVYLGATGTSWRPLAPNAIQVALQTLGGVAVVCSVALLLASLAALPMRARQNRAIDDYIARGEVDWMRAQSSIRNASAPVETQPG